MVVARPSCRARRCNPPQRLGPELAPGRFGDESVCQVGAHVMDEQVAEQEGSPRTIEPRGVQPRIRPGRRPAALAPLWGRGPSVPSAQPSTWMRCEVEQLVRRQFGVRHTVVIAGRSVGCRGLPVRQQARDHRPRPAALCGRRGIHRQSALGVFGEGSVVMPRWLNNGPRMNPSMLTVCALRPK